MLNSHQALQVAVSAVVALAAFYVLYSLLDFIFANISLVGSVVGVLVGAMLVFFYARVHKDGTKAKQ